VLAAEYESGGSSEIAGDELFDFLGWKPALDLLRTGRANRIGSPAGPASCIVTGGAEDLVVKLPNSSLNLGIHQINPWDAVLDSHSPW
jgi:hypothetical protein